jgi:hypothetical protein
MRFQCESRYILLIRGASAATLTLVAPWIKIKRPLPLALPTLRVFIVDVVPCLVR